MTITQHIDAGIERRAREMYQEDMDGLGLSLSWEKQADEIKTLYRASARKELHEEAR